jgi:aspartate racemase
MVDGTRLTTDDVGGDRLVGVIGGMGPEATIDFMSRVLSNTPATVDQDHVRMIIHHDPRIPSRQLAMRGKGESPGPAMAALASSLESSGADFIVMPCNLGHAWQTDIVNAIHIPFISIIDVTVSAALQHSTKGSPVGLMTTPGCFHAGLYQQALKKAGRPIVLQTPDELHQTMLWVDRIKAGDKSDRVAEGLRRLGNALIARGAKVLIAACTEFPLVLDKAKFDVPFISSTDELAKHAVALALERQI